MPSSYLTYCLVSRPGNKTMLCCILLCFSKCLNLHSYLTCCSFASHACIPTKCNYKTTSYDNKLWNALVDVYKERVRNYKRCYFAVLLWEFIASLQAWNLTLELKRLISSQFGDAGSKRLLFTVHYFPCSSIIQSLVMVAEVLKDSVLYSSI